ncbi:PREDICTED: chymotrypsin inhibitor-like isoform X1 [Nicrophorus vespilloides]|uniref:Chymotrypsin inhibitor-like isoform X1 n=1 Tax=Nicrophorus vespilloides TaxID=110193 RepID=A0ABM1NJI6_NICVS|nr:PREDICTED: chymotrypsin inhibitor-like isoform X1 [Nicrophorus vespilloides]
MKSRIMFCLLLVAMCSVAEQCGKNEVFNLCGSACHPNERSCILPILLVDVNCLAVCISMCVCTPGYLRHPSGYCVTQGNC